MIRLDLNNLTQAMVDEATPNMGRCLYQAPCIIGTLMAPNERRTLDEASACHKIDIEASDSILTLGLYAQVPDDQRTIACELQEAFDMMNVGKLEAMLQSVNPDLVVKRELIPEHVLEL